MYTKEDLKTDIDYLENNPEPEVEQTLKNIIKEVCGMSEVNQIELLKEVFLG